MQTGGFWPYCTFWPTIGTYLSLDYVANWNKEVPKPISKNLLAKILGSFTVRHEQQHGSRYFSFCLILLHERRQFLHKTLSPIFKPQYNKYLFHKTVWLVINKFPTNHTLVEKVIVKVNDGRVCWKASLETSATTPSTESTVQKVICGLSHCKTFVRNWFISAPIVCWR